MKIKAINHIAAMAPGDANNWKHLFNAIMSISKFSNLVFAFSYLTIESDPKRKAKISIYDTNNEIFATIAAPNYFPCVGDKECHEHTLLIGSDPVRFFVFGHNLLSEDNRLLLNEEGAFLINEY